MSHGYFYLIFAWVIQPVVPVREAIDALNRMPYEQMVARAATLDKPFLKNAQQAHQIGYELGEAESYEHLSLIYYTQGKYALEVQYSLKAIGLYEKLHQPEKLAMAYGELGYRMKRRNMAQAQHYMQKGKRIAEQGSYVQPLLSLYNNYGVLKEMQQSLDSALYFYQKGLQLKERIRDSVGLPYSLNNIAGVHVLRGEFALAAPLLKRALDIRVRRKDRAGMLESYLCFGDFYRKQNQLRPAIEWYDRALEQAQAQGYLDYIQQSHQALATCYETLGQNAQALKHFKAYQQYHDSLVNLHTNNKIAELEVRFQTNEKEKQIAQHQNELLRKNSEVRQAHYQLAGLGLVALFVALLGYLLYRQQRLRMRQQQHEFALQTALAQMETQNQLQEQRLRISRDLHDNIGAQLTFVISSIDNLKYAFDIQHAPLRSKLDEISAFTQSTITELRDTIWAMNAAELTLEDLRLRVLHFIEKAQSAQPHCAIVFEVDSPLQALTLSAAVGIHLYRTLQEAVHNTLKYAQATELRIRVRKTEKGLSMRLQDNGKGFNIDQVVHGNGLYNMQKRIESLGGVFEIQSTEGAGTVIEAHIPL